MTSSFTTGAATDSKPDSCFFYGTLMFPAIVTRLLGRSASELDFSEAILPGFVRLHIKERDYPALVTLEDANKTFGNLGEDSVKGVLVKGLTSAEMDLLDEWEGDEYFKTTTEVTNSSGEKKKAWIYQWGPEWMSMLLPRVWHFDAFVYASKSRLLKNNTEAFMIQSR